MRYPPLLRTGPPYTSTVGWVDIGNVAKVPLNVVAYLKKVGKIT
jgi:hypothetical protein